VAGALTILAGGTVWILGQLPKLRKLYAWRTKVDIVAFDSAHGMTVVNVGDGPVLLTHFMMEIPGIGSETLTIDEVIQPSQILRKSFGYNPNAKEYVLINHGSLDVWRQAVIQARMGYGANCVSAIVLSESGSSLAMFKDVDSRDRHAMRFLNASLSVHYNDLRGATGKTTVPVRGVLYARRNCPVARDMFASP
jgi:hypothetical protein